MADGCEYVNLNEQLTGRRLPGSGSGRFTYSIVADGAKGHAEITNRLTGEFVYQPFANSRGTDTFTFRAHDGERASVATFRIVYVPRIMPLGDSITDGVTDDPPDDEPGDGNNPPVGQRVGYRGPLYAALTEEMGYRVDFVGRLVSGQDAMADPNHEGHGGWRADEIVAGRAGSGNLSQWLDDQMPDVVLLHAGTNDLNGSSDPVDESNDIERILREIDTWESSHWPVTVVVARIINTNPPSGRTTAFNDSVIQNFVVPRIEGRNQLIWVDAEAALNSSDFYADDLHPNATGYERMAEVWLYPLTGAGRRTGSHEGSGILPKCP